MSTAVELCILRHAEADSGSPDIARELSVAGKERAANLGTELADKQFAVVLASSAVRAQQTLAPILAAHTTPITEQHSDEKFYEGSADTWLAAIQALTATKILLVGHNPTLSILATKLAGEHIHLRPGEYYEHSGPLPQTID